VSHLPLVDIIVLVVYLAGVVGFGCWFVRRSGSTEQFMVAGRSLPAWAVGLSIFGTYLSSNTFLGVPGKAYSTNWNALVFSFSLPLSAWFAVKFFVPFYRHTGEISAYHHLEHRFGPWARTYAVVCYLLTQLARTGSVMFGVSLALSALTGWDMATIIVLAGLLITLYTVLGGIEAVIWTDVVQSIVLLVGAISVFVLLCLDMPEGPGQIFRIGSAEEKLSLGSFALDFTNSTFWVVLLYGLLINMNNFGIDQSFVQRYHTAKSDREAARSVLVGAWLYLPVSLLFFVIGTALFAFYQTHPDERAALEQSVAQSKLAQEDMPVDELTVQAAIEKLTDADIGDKALPHFIVHELPTGMAGLLVAAIFAAAMSSIDTSLNSSATVILQDIYRRYFRPQATEKESMRALYAGTIAMGACGTAIALAMIGVKSVLDVWWTLSGVFAAGMLGLFLLGLFSRRASSPIAATAVVIGVLVVLWISLSQSWGTLVGNVSIENGSHQLVAESPEMFGDLHAGDELVVGKTRVRIAQINAEKDIATIAEPFRGEDAQQVTSYLNDLGYRLRSPLHKHMAIVLGTFTILLVGFLMSRSNHPPQQAGQLN